MPESIFDPADFKDGQAPIWDAKLQKFVGKGVVRDDIQYSNPSFIKTLPFKKIAGVSFSGINTGDQTIVLTGDVSGNGKGPITTRIGRNRITNAMLVGGITADKLIGADITTLGTVATGEWRGTVIGSSYGGAGAVSGLLKADGSGTVSAAVPDSDYVTPAGVVAYVGVGFVPVTRTVNGYPLSANVTVTKSDIGLGSVENTALSTWTGTTNITTVGTIATGVWSGTALEAAKLPATVAYTDAANTFVTAQAITAGGNGSTGTISTSGKATFGTISTSGKATFGTGTSGTTGTVLDLNCGGFYFRWARNGSTGQLEATNQQQYGWSWSGGPTYFNSSAVGVIPVIVKGATSQSANLQEWQNSSSTVGACITASREFSNASQADRSEKFGVGAVVGIDGVAFGNGASSYGSGVSIGRLCVMTSGGIGIGYGISATGVGSIVIGTSASSNTSNHNIIIGNSAAVTGFDSSVVIGNSMSATAGNQLVVGAVTAGFFGNGVTAASPASFTLNATGGSGTNIAGATLTLAGGKGTGTGTPGSVSFQTSTAGSTGTTLQSLTERFLISQTTQQALLTVGAASLIGLTIRGATSQSGNLQEWQDSTSAIGAKVNASKEFSNTGTYTTSEMFGAGAAVSGNNATAVGAGATAVSLGTALGYLATAAGPGITIGTQASIASGSEGIAIGYQSSAAGGNGLVIGKLATLSNHGVAIGHSASGAFGDTIVGHSATGGSGGANTVIGYGASTSSGSRDYCVVIGHTASAGSRGAIAIGHTATTTANGQLVIGGVGSFGFGPISAGYIGNGVTAASPTSFTLNATGGSGTDIAGGTLTLAGGKGTGAGAVGVLNFQTSTLLASGSTLQTLTTRLSINGVGKIQATGGGYYSTTKNSAPADSELAAGEAACWYDSTNGASAFNIKAKQADGTVKTATIPLS